MIHTIHFTLAGRLRPEFRSFLDLPPEWVASGFGRLGLGDTPTIVDLYFPAIELHVVGTGRYFTSARVNLPEILYGHSGRLIATEDEFLASLGLAHAYLSSVLEPAFPNTAFIPGYPSASLASHFTRIDLPWHFPSNSGVFTALAYAQHDSIRSVPSLLKGQTASLRGTVLEITAYEKIRQMRLRSRFPHEIIRAEFRLSKTALSKKYKGPDECGFTHVNVDWCRRTMRKIAGELHADVIPRSDGDGSVAQYVADLERDCPLIEATERYVRTKNLSRESAEKFRRTVRRLQNADRTIFEIADFFPDGFWNTPLHIELPDIEAKHRESQQRYFEKMNIHPKTIHP